MHTDYQNLIVYTLVTIAIITLITYCLKKNLKSKSLCNKNCSCKIKQKLKQ